LPEVDPSAVEAALTLVCDAFMIPREQRYSLRPADELLWLYREGYLFRIADSMEFEHLFLGIQDVLARSLKEREVAAIRTVGDVIRVVGAGRLAQMLPILSTLLPNNSLRARTTEAQFSLSSWIGGCA
jgi:hypothetical protein